MSESSVKATWRQIRRVVGPQAADLLGQHEQAIRLLRMELIDQRKRLEGLAAQFASVQANRQDRDLNIWTRLSWLLGIRDDG